MDRTKAMEERIRTTLRDYRQIEVADEDGGGYPLVDALTLEGHGIDMGEREIDNIVSELMFALSEQWKAPQPIGSDAWQPMDSAPTKAMVSAANQALFKALADPQAQVPGGYELAVIGVNFDYVMPKALAAGLAARPKAGSDR